MGIGRTPAADETGLRTYEVAMRFITFADRLHERGCALILLYRS
jgi:hypothetical protein